MELTGCLNTSRKQRFTLLCSLIILLPITVFGQEAWKWTARSSGTTVDLIDVEWGNNLFVAVGNNGTIVSSSDGVQWNTEISGTTHNLRKVLWAGNQFVAGGDSGTIITSPDGKIWTDHSIATTEYVSDIAWGAEKMVLFTVRKNLSRYYPLPPGLYGYLYSSIYMSTDGMTWTKQISADTIGFNNIYWVGDKFIAIANKIINPTINTGYTDCSSTIYSSSDGLSWTKLSRTGYLQCMAFNGKTYVAAGVYGTGNAPRYTRLTSPDGISWSGQNYIGGGSYLSNEDIIWCKDKFIILNFAAYGYATYFAFSDNGVTWQSAAQSCILDKPSINIPGTAYYNKPFYSMAYGKELLVAVGSSGFIYALDSIPVKVNRSVNPDQFAKWNVVITNRTIDYILPSAGYVSLNLYSLSGTLAQSLVNTHQSAGTHSVMVPDILSAGTYLIDARIGNSKVEKMIATIIRK
jgi:hypothetical protein